MNKKQVDKLLPVAYEALNTSGLVSDNKLPKGLRGQISSFGAAVSAGSLLAAAAFFNEQGGAKTERHKLMDAINSMLKSENLVKVRDGKTLFDTIKCNSSDREIKEKVLNCAVALKLAMNLYHLDEDKKGQSQSGEEGAS